MATRTRPTLAKREKEKARIERRKEKEAKRVDAKERKAHAPTRADGVDPDIADIKLGPQPHPFLDDDEIEPSS